MKIVTVSVTIFILVVAGIVMQIKEPANVSAVQVAAETTELQKESLTGLSEEEQTSIDQDKRNFTDYISWAMLGSGILVLAFGIFRVHRMMKD